LIHLPTSAAFLLDLCEPGTFLKARLDVDDDRRGTRRPRASADRILDTIDRKKAGVREAYRGKGVRARNPLALDLPG
jgi:hypothetical protein